MKILVSNYVTPYSTEAIYLNTAFNAAGCMSTLWPHNVSTYDIFDLVQPDIHVTHHSRLSMDLALYLKESNKNVELLINISGLKQNQFAELEQNLASYNIKPKLFFVNYHDHNLTSRHNNIMTLLCGADVFLGTEKKFYEIDYGIIVDEKQSISPIGQTYHYLSTNEKLKNDVDICMPLHQLTHLFGNYKNIVFKQFSGLIPQVFYNAAYYNNNVFFDLEDRSKIDVILNKILGDGEHCNLQNPISGNIREKIAAKHTCLHRAKSLLSQLPCKDNLDKLQLIIDGVK